MKIFLSFNINIFILLFRTYLLYRSKNFDIFLPSKYIFKNNSNLRKKIIKFQGAQKDGCEIFCLQPDNRLCQCSKQELNKYILYSSSYDSTNALEKTPNLDTNSKVNNITEISNISKKENITVPHIYQSIKEKKTCGEYSLIIRKLNIAISRTKVELRDKNYETKINLNSLFLKNSKKVNYTLPQQFINLYFEPTIDFQIKAPSNHSISSLFYWGDFVALYSTNPYKNFSKYLNGCIWQIPSGENSYYSSIESKLCRKSIMDILIKNQGSQNINSEKFFHLCIWSYERYWNDFNSGPCLCCEVDFNSCQECYKCLNKGENEEDNDNDNSLKECLERKDMVCYKCMNFNYGNFNCQSYEQFLTKMLQDAKINNKYHILTKNRKTLIDSFKY